MTAIQPSGLHPGHHVGPAAASAAHRDGHEHHAHAGHRHPDHAHLGHHPAGDDRTERPASALAHPSRIETAAPLKHALSPLASAGASRVAKTACAVALLWIAVAWALGWLGP